ncbi:MAG: hypothetical protein IPL39_15365 [Opitutaceae bacterium]|nr:hypothetical protein [Opitutaceae bacterium]
MRKVIAMTRTQKILLVFAIVLTALPLAFFAFVLRRYEPESAFWILSFWGRVLAIGLWLAASACYFFSGASMAGAECDKESGQRSKTNVAAATILIATGLTLFGVSLYAGLLLIHRP